MSHSYNKKSFQCRRDTQKNSYRIVFMGGKGVGKTAIIKRHIHNVFPVRHVPTVEDLYRVVMKTKDDGTRMTLDILDTSGDGQFPAMRALAIRQSDAFVLVCAVNDEEDVIMTSYAEVAKLRQTIIDIRGKTVPIIVVANKNDDNHWFDNLVTFEATVLIDWNNTFLTCSAKENLNISKIFEEVASQIKKATLRCDDVETVYEG
ncbi:GTP-binding protein Di-Ras1-like [Tubulanus polymorphus]|uniref:GTP-binding protein Di-Ras1-like n=1 Tax=Tubulanus polymorphus TaxID=672921 RepID=UPI003DA3E8EE